MKKGLLIVNTGDGKGKSTAAFGMVFRAWGRNFRICVIQFIKAETGQWGEIKAAKKLGIEMKPLRRHVMVGNLPKKKLQAINMI
jgi:cob(I)alamin adenosyltransferase